jgi:sulfatase maturation enzyme AslB (radical SAM superfamily)
MINRLKKGDTFCVFPWIAYHSKTDGKQYFCCYSNVPITDEAFTNITRQKILNNEKVSHCNHCYSLEENNVLSPRQRESVLWLKDVSISNIFKIESDYEPLFLDIRADNKCNLACIGCGPSASTLWQKELEIPTKRYSQLLDFEKIKKVKKIYMAGGEPFIINNYLNIIDFIAAENPDIELVINTNLTRLPDSAIKSLQKIKKVCIIVSLDAYGKVNEYHRYPLKWDKFVRNLDILQKTGIRIEFNTVVDAVSIFGFKELNKLEHYAKRWDLQILTNPTALVLENIPNNLRHVAVENAESLKNLRFYSTDQKYKTTVNLILSTLSKSGDSAQLSKYIQELDTRRKINHLDYIGVNLINTKNINEN